MLISLKVENFLSFKDPTLFSLETEPIKEHYHTNTAETSITGLRVLKGCAIYGPNAGGKSNLLKALRFVVRFMTESAIESQANDNIDVTHFRLSTTTENKPSFFELKIIVDNILYRYGFEVDKEKVHKEWLFYSKKIKEYQLFERIENKYVIDDKFEEAKDIQIKTRINTLFLSAVAQWNGKTANSILQKIRKILFLGEYPLNANKTLELYENPKYKNAIINFLESADLGFKDFNAEQINYPQNLLENLTTEVKNQLPKKQIYTLHNKLDEANAIVDKEYFSLQFEESQGTNKFFNLAGYVVDAIFNGKTLVIDEFTSRLHPLLARHIISTFHSPDINKTGAQLIFTSHNTYLMNIKWYRRDQIFIVYKLENYASTITTFFKENIRNDSSFEKRFFESGSHGLPKIKRPEIITNQLDLFTENK